MASKIELVIFNGHNYVVWALDMETLLKTKGLSQNTKIVIPKPIDSHAKFFIDGKKDEEVEVIMTYILREICFHTSAIDYPHEV